MHGRGLGHRSRVRTSPPSSATAARDPAAARERRRRDRDRLVRARPGRRRRGLRDARLRRERRPACRPLARDGGHVRGRRIRCNVVAPGPDRDADEPAARRATNASARACPSSSRSPATSAVPRTSPARSSTSRPRRSSPAPCSPSTGAGRHDEPRRPRRRRHEHQAGRARGRRGRRARLRAHPLRGGARGGARPAGRPRAREREWGIGRASPFRAWSTARARGLLFPNLHGDWRGRPIREPLSRALGRPVALVNDGHAFALAEARVGAASGAQGRDVRRLRHGRSAAGSSLGGRLHLGSTTARARSGTTPSTLDGPLCKCGNHGCLELLRGRPRHRPHGRAGQASTTHSRRRARGDERARSPAIRPRGEVIGVAVANPHHLPHPRARRDRRRRRRGGGAAHGAAARRAPTGAPRTSPRSSTSKSSAQRSAPRRARSARRSSPPTRPPARSRRERSPSPSPSRSSAASSAAATRRRPPHTPSPSRSSERRSSSRRGCGSSRSGTALPTR